MITISRKSLSIAVLSLLAVISISGCKQKDNSNAEAINQVQNDYENVVDNVKRMQNSFEGDTASIGGTIYRYTIERKADDSLPKVEDEDGTIFADNKITLHIEKAGQEIFSHAYTKADFANFLTASEELSKNGVLEGFVFYAVNEQKLQFIASICIPQTDLYYPILITVSGSGSVSYSSATSLEAEEYNSIPEE